MLCREGKSVTTDHVRFRAAAILVFLLAGSLQSRCIERNDPSLQDLHDAAVRFQQAGDLRNAAAQYAKFLASALTQVAISRAETGQYRKATPLFEEALALDGVSAAVGQSYASAALRAGDLSRAESLAQDLLKKNSDHSKPAAEAHHILGRVFHMQNRDQDARVELEAAVAADPSFTNRYDLAVICLDLDDEKCAVENFDRIEASMEDSPALHMQIGMAYGNSDFTPKAVTEFKNVLARDPRYPGAHYCLAAALLAAGEDEKTLQEAEAQLKLELAVSPRDFLTHAALGKIEATYHRYTEAERYLKRAILLNPKNPDAFLYLGQMYFDTNRPGQAAINLRKAIQLTTDISRNHFQVQKAHFLLGRILMQEHREEEARAEMQIARSFTERALKKDRNKLAGTLSGAGEQRAPSSPSNDSPVTLALASAPAEPLAAERQRAFEKQLVRPIAESYNNLGAMAASQQRYTEALNYFKRAAAWDPMLGGVDYNIGHAAFLASRFPDAIPPLTRHLRLHPGDSGARAALALSEFMVRAYGTCLDVLKGANREVLAIPQMQYIYAESLMKTGQVSRGQQRMQELEAAHPEIAEVHRSLGELATARQEWQKALQELKEAHRLNGSDPDTHFDMAKVALEIGNTRQAIRELETAVRLMPDRAEFHRELASAYERAFQMSDAEREREIYEKLTESRAAISPGNSPDTKRP